MKNPLRIAIYFGIGAVCHLFFVGSRLDWSSAWTFAWLFAWPVMLVIAYWMIVVCITVLALMFTGIMLFAGRP